MTSINNARDARSQPQQIVPIKMFLTEFERDALPPAGCSSVATAMARTPTDSHSDASAESTYPRRAASITETPARADPSATPWPKPLDASVITATLPFKLLSPTRASRGAPASVGRDTLSTSNTFDVDDCIGAAEFQAMAAAQETVHGTAFWSSPLRIGS